MKKINSFIQLPDSVKSAIVFFVASLISRGINIITTPIFTRLMSPDQIGICTTFTSWYSLIMTVSTLSLTSGGYTIGLKEYESDRDNYVSSVLFLTSLSAFVFAVIYIFDPSFWQKTLGLNNSLIVLMLIGFLVEPAKSFWMSRQRYEYKYKLLGFINIGSALFAALLSVYFVKKNVLFDLATSRLVGSYSVLFVSSIILWIYIFFKGRKPINKKYWLFSLRLSIPLIGYAFASQILSVSDRIMIDHLVGKREVGIYGIIYTVSSLSLMVWSAIIGSFEPYLYKNFELHQKKIRKIANLLLALYALLEIALVLCAPEIVNILATEEYYEAIYLMPPIAAGVFFTSVSNLYSDVLVYFKKTILIMLSAVVAATLNVLLNLIFINKFGYMAAAYTTLITYMIMSLILCLLANTTYKKYFKQPFYVYSNKKIAVISLITVIISMSGIALYQFFFVRWAMIVLLILGSVWLFIKWGKIRSIKGSVE